MGYWGEYLFVVWGELSHLGSLKGAVPTLPWDLRKLISFNILRNSYVASRYILLAFSQTISMKASTNQRHSTTCTCLQGCMAWFINRRSSLQP